MKKEDIEIIAKLLTTLKDSLNELESSLKKDDAEKVTASKRKILDLQIQIGRKL